MQADTDQLSMLHVTVFNRTVECATCYFVQEDTNQFNVLHVTVFVRGHQSVKYATCYCMKEDTNQLNMLLVTYQKRTQISFCMKKNTN